MIDSKKRIDYRKNVIKNMSTFGRVLFYSGCIQIRIKEEKAKFSNDTYLTHDERINPYNPISYIGCLALILYTGIVLLITDVIPDLRKSFKWN